MGSALTAVIGRASRPRSLLTDRSRCPTCRHVLAPKDLIPVISFLRLRGQCRYCRRAIPRWYPVVELATIVLFVSAATLLPSVPPGALVLLWALLACLFALAIVDLQTMRLPDALVLTFAVAALFRSVVFGIPPLPEAVGGGLLGFALFGILHALSSVIPRWRGSTTMGFGDVKLAGALGLALGVPGMIAGAFLAFGAGGVVGSGLLLMKRATWSSHVPFGPFLAGAGILLLVLPALPARLFSLMVFQ